MPESKSGALGHLATPQWEAPLSFFVFIRVAFSINRKPMETPVKIGHILIATQRYVNEKLENSEYL